MSFSAAVRCAAGVAEKWRLLLFSDVSPVVARRAGACRVRSAGLIMMECGAEDKMSAVRCSSSRMGAEARPAVSNLQSACFSVHKSTCKFVRHSSMRAGRDEAVLQVHLARAEISDPHAPRANQLLAIAQLAARRVSASAPFGLSDSCGLPEKLAEILSEPSRTVR